MSKIAEKVSKYFLRKAETITGYARKRTIFGFAGIPIYYVASYFFKGIAEGSLTTRASSIAFNFFLAIFPAIIFIFTLIPYIPIDNFQEELILLIADVMPQNAYSTIQETLEDIIRNQRSSLLSLGFVAALIFSTNGISSMISAFNASIHVKESRTWLEERFISIVLVIILAFLLTTAIILVAFSHYFTDFLVSHNFITSDGTLLLLILGKWIIILGLFFFTISFLYYFAPARRRRWRFFSSGATFATIFCIIGSLGFSFYVNNFGQYNKLYGSIGTLIVILMWIYYNALILLTGFELNISIQHAQAKKMEIVSRKIENTEANQNKT